MSVTITTGRKRIRDVHAQDVIYINGVWRLVYDAMEGGDIDESAWDASSIAELVKAAGCSLGDLDERDTILRIARDEDRTESGCYEDAWRRYRNPYELVEFQIEVNEP